MDFNQFIPAILNSLKDAQTNNCFNQEINKTISTSGKNEFLFFIKPELTLTNFNIKLEDILQLIFEEFNTYKINIQNVRVINAAYLKKYNIIGQHYGVISQLSSNLQKSISNDAKMRFEEIYDEAFENAKIYGSIEFLEKYPDLSPTSLSILWQNSKFEKLAGGTYAEKLSIDGETVYLVNGFHPRQLEHYTLPGRAIVVMALNSNIDWNIARNKLIGKTTPIEAEPGSIRRELFEKKSQLGLLNISPSWNGVHLSAGPVEGLIELLRYNSDFDSGIETSLKDYKFGRSLLELFGEQKTNQILKNPTLQYKGKNISIFDLTEEMNSENCIEVLKDVIL